MSNIYIARVYADLIRKELKKLENVPPEIRSEVEELLTVAEKGE